MDLAGPAGRPGDLESFERLRLVAAAMSRAVAVRDRRYHLRLYRNVFVGHEAVDWLVREGHAPTRRDAVALGQRCLELGLFHHCLHEHTFKDLRLFYRFTLAPPRAHMEEIPDASDVADDAPMGRRNLSAGHELARIKRRQGELEADMQRLAAVNGALSTDLAAAHRGLARHARGATFSQGVLSGAFWGWAAGYFDDKSGTWRAGGPLQRCGDWAVLGWRWAGCRGPVLAGAALTCMTAAFLLGRARSGLSADTWDWDGPGPPWEEPLRLVTGLPRALALGAEGAAAAALRWSGRAAAALASVAGAASGSGGPPRGGQGEGGNPMPSSVDDLRLWGEGPLLLRPGRGHDSPAGPDLPEGPSSSAPPRVNAQKPFHFATRGFEGRAVLWVAGLPSSPPEAFEGRKRRTMMVVQGRFTRPLSFDEVWTGQEFETIKDLPAAWLTRLLAELTRKLSPSTDLGDSRRPHLLSPLAASANAIHVARPGQEPPLSVTQEPVEDMTLCGLNGPDGRPLPASLRRRCFSRKHERDRFVFDPSLVYTFYFWQHMLDVTRHRLDVGFASFDLRPHIPGQPLKLMAKTRPGGDYLWCFELWHESALARDKAAAKM